MHRLCEQGLQLKGEAWSLQASKLEAANVVTSAKV